jgi:hypothetical protein
VTAPLRRGACAVVAATVGVLGLGVVSPAAAAAPSTTVLAVDGAVVPAVVAGYGQDLTLTAQVTVEGSQPTGWVFFVVDGLSRRADVRPDGMAAAPLTDDLRAGMHQVSATFVPADPTQQDGSTSTTTTLQVVTVSTKPRVRAHGQRAGRSVQVRTRVRATYGTTPTGTVQVTLRRLGEQWRWTRRADLDDASATVTFRPRRPFAPGRYHVVVRYTGDANHGTSRKGRDLQVGR